MRSRFFGERIFFWESMRRAGQSPAVEFVILRAIRESPLQFVHRHRFNHSARVGTDILVRPRANTVRPYELYFAVGFVQNPNLLGRFVNRPYDATNAPWF